MADDMTWRDCGAYAGMPGVYVPGQMPGDLTPHMETLAEDGLRFNACFSATAMCAPLRQQLYTGIYPVRSGAYPNHGEVKPGTQSIVHHLTALGYRVGLMGKKHFGPQDSFPFEILGLDTDTEASTNITAAVEFINRDPSQPYCLIVTSHNPIVPWNHGNYVEDNTTLPIAADCVDTPEYRTSFNSYLGEVKAFDNEVGMWMDRIAVSPDPDNTIVICLTEQGAQLPGAKWTCYDAGIMTGCLICWPAHVTPGSKSDALIEFGDFVPTLCEAAGGSVPKGLRRLDGLSFLPVLLGEKMSHRPYVHSIQTTREVIGQPDTGYAVRPIRDNRMVLRKHYV